MTDKVTLSSISPTNSVTTAAATINSNNAAIVAAMDNTLSLNGLAPNQMESNLDMNSNQILNLPAPVAANSPARLVDILSNPTLTLTIPPIGTSGSVVGLLNTSNTFSGANTFSGSNTFSTNNTFSSTTAFNGNVTINSSLPLTLISNSPGGSEIGLQHHDPNMVTTNNLIFPIGRDESNYDRAQIGFYYSSLNSVNNKGWVGLYGADHTLNWDGNQFVGVNTGTNTLTKRFTVNSANNFSVDDSGNVLQAGSITNTSAGNFIITAASSQQIVMGATGGAASLVINASSVVYPSVDNTLNLGGGSLRWGSIFGYNLVAVTSLGFQTGTGAGGTVTQSTNKSTAVTLSTPSGQITMNSASLAATTIVSFTLNNTAIAATDVLILNHVSGGTVGSYTLNAQCGSGSATINIRNNTAAGLSEALVIGYVLIKGSTN